MQSAILYWSMSTVDRRQRFSLRPNPSFFLIHLFYSKLCFTNSFSLSYCLSFSLSFLLSIFLFHSFFFLTFSISLMRSFFFRFFPQFSHFLYCFLQLNVYLLSFYHISIFTFFVLFCICMSFDM